MGNDDSNVALVTILKFFVGLALVPYNAWVASSLWVWHLVPLGMSHIGFWSAFGIIALIAWFKNEPYMDHGETYQERGTREIMVPILCYGLGYIAYVNNVIAP